VIVVDTSALIAIAREEAGADACIAVLERERDVRLYAATLFETLIVAEGRNVTEEMERLLRLLRPAIADVTEASARRASHAYRRWGKGYHPAGLNMGDCYAYELAMFLGCQLLYVGDDFSRTDVVVAR
jgi:ribonuclease VapC